MAGTAVGQLHPAPGQGLVDGACACRGAESPHPATGCAGPVSRGGLARQGVVDCLCGLIEAGRGGFDSRYLSALTPIRSVAACAVSTTRSVVMMDDDDDI